MISCIFSFYSSAAHPAKARPLFSLLCQCTPWAVTMSVTPSQHMQHFYSNFPHYRENVTLSCFENFQILHSCLRPTIMPTPIRALYNYAAYWFVCAHACACMCVYPDIYELALATWHNVTCLPLSYNLLQPPHRNREK